MELVCNSLLKRAKWCLGLGFGLLEKRKKRPEFMAPLLKDFI
jgi:hypothetical protein